MSQGLNPIIQTVSFLYAIVIEPDGGKYPTNLCADVYLIIEEIFKKDGQTWARGRGSLFKDRLLGDISNLARYEFSLENESKYFIVDN